MSRVKVYEKTDWSKVRPKSMASDSVLTVFRVPQEFAGARLDIFLKNQFRRTSRTRTQKIIKLSAFDAQGRSLKPHTKVKNEEHIFLWRAPWDETPVPNDIPILYEDDHLLAVSKPAHLPVHPTARYHKNTLIKMLQAMRQDAFLTLGHRLDRETSGVLLLAKTPICDRHLKKMFESRNEIQKIYVAYTWNSPKYCRLNEPYRYEAHMKLDPKGRYQVEMVLSSDDDALYSSTRFTLLETKGAKEKPTPRSPAPGIFSASPSTEAPARYLGYSKVRCELETGRQHQIRVHLASLGAPVVGDKLYGPDPSCFARNADNELTSDDLILLETQRHCLHAAQMILPHPVNGKMLDIEAPEPNDMSIFWRSVESSRRT